MDRSIVGDVREHHKITASAPLPQDLLLILHLVLTMAVRAQATTKSHAGDAISFQNQALLSNHFWMSLLDIFTDAVLAQTAPQPAGDAHRVLKQNLASANRFQEPFL